MIATPARLLLDEHVWEGLAEVLVQRGHDVVHFNLTGQRGLDDGALLQYATLENRAILTFNARDFVPLARMWFELGREHFGIILSVQVNQGELLRQTDVMLSTSSADALRNTVHWLQEFRSA